MDVVRLDADGVPFFWIESPPPYRVCLQFRLGWADETLARHGVTHLCEHLALTAFQGASHPLNGHVSCHRTAFVGQGDADQCRAFLATVAARLADLPVEGIEREKGILRVEARRRARGLVDVMLLNRFGARSYGLGALPEFGLWSLDASVVGAWAAHGFTRGNAAGWVLGPEPLRLELPLPDGPRLPPPAREPLAREFPAVGRVAGRFVGASGVVRRSSASLITGAVFARRLRRRLRFEMGAAYEVSGAYLPLDETTAHMTVWSDVADEKGREVVRTFLATLRDVELAAIEEDLEPERTAAVAALDGHDVEMALLDGHAFGELIRAETPTRDELRAQYLAVTTEDVRAVAAEMRASAVYEVPPGIDVALDGLRALPRWSSWSVEGEVFPPVDGLPGTPERFVLGRTGLTVWVGDRPLSVAWNDVVAMPCWSDGGRQLIGDDGTRIAVAPSRIRCGRDLVEKLDEQVSPDLRVHVGKRLGGLVAPAVRRDPLTRRHWARQQALNVVLGGVLLIFLLALLGPGRPPLAKALTLALAEMTSVGVLMGVAAVTLRRDTAVGGGKGGTEVFDNAEAHRPRLGADAPATAAYVRGGTLLAFLVLHELGSEWFLRESGADVGRLKRREITGPELYRDWDGLLASDMVSATGGEFLFDLLSIRPKTRSRFGHILQAVGGPYALPATWDGYDQVAPRLERELVRWRRWRLVRRAARMFRSPPAF